MKRTKRPSRSRAHDFSALSTSIGVALTLALWGAMVVGAMVVQELRRDWMSSMRVEVVLEDVPENEAAVQAWLDAMRANNAVVDAVYLDPGLASKELEKELGEPFMEFLGESPLPPVIELALEREWIGREGLSGLEDQVDQWSGMEGVVRVEYPEVLLGRLEKGFEDWTYPGLMLMVVLMLIVVAQITNVVRLSVFGRRFLIRSMELVGAPPHKIRRPFIAEAMGYGIIGALLAYALVVFALNAVQSFLPATLGAWGAEQLGAVLASQLLVGLVLTGLSARWAVGRYFGARLDRLV